MEKTPKNHKNGLNLRRMKSWLVDKMESPVAISVGVVGAVAVCLTCVLGGISYFAGKDGESLEKESKAVCDYDSADKWYGLPDEMNEAETLERLRGLGHGGNTPLELGKVSCDRALDPAYLNGSLVTVKQKTWIFTAKKACMTVVLPEQYEQPSQPNEVYVVCSTPLPGSP